MSRTVEECHRRMLRARDAMDRAYAEPHRTECATQPGRETLRFGR